MNTQTAETIEAEIRSFLDQIAGDGCNGVDELEEAYLELFRKVYLDGRVTEKTRVARLSIFLRNIKSRYGF